MEKNTATLLNVIGKPLGQTGFAVIPKRWVVEHSIAGGLSFMGRFFGKGYADVSTV
jgi:hypothetical protein